MKTKIRSLYLSVLTFLTTVCIALIFIFGVNTDETANADTATLAKTNYSISTNGNYMLIATPITGDFDTTVVYEVGYIFTGTQPTIVRADLKKYYTTINGLSAQELWGEPYTDETPIIVWEIENDDETLFEVTAYYKVGEIDETDGLLYPTEPVTIVEGTTRILKVYTITFEVDGGAEIAAEKADYGTLIEEYLEGVEVTPQVGYHFDKWKKKTGNTYANFDGTETLTENITVKAVCSINTYALTFEMGDGEAIAPIEDYYNTPLSEMLEGVEAIAPTGYCFDKWQKKTGVDTYADLDGSETLTDDITIKAVYKHIYTVEFFEEDGGEISSVSYVEGEEFVVPAARSLIGKSLIGWKHNEGTQAEPSWAVYNMDAENALVVSGDMQFKANYTSEYGSYSPEFDNSTPYYYLPIAESDLDAGTSVEVTATFALGFTSDANKSRLINLKDTNRTVDINEGFANYDYANATNIYNFDFAGGNWHTFSFKTVVQNDGTIQIAYALWDPATSRIPETLYYKDVTVTAISDIGDYGEVSITTAADKYETKIDITGDVSETYAVGTKVVVTADFRFVLSSLRNASLLRGAGADGKVDVSLPTITGQAGTATGPETVTTWNNYTFIGYVQEDGKVAVAWHMPNGMAGSVERVYFKNVNIIGAGFGADIKSAWNQVNPIAQTDYADGTTVRVRLKVWLGGSAPTNANLFLGSYMTTAQTVGQSTTVVTTGTTPSMVGTWTEIEYDACVRDGGKVYLIARIADNAANTSYYMAIKDVVVGFGGDIKSAWNQVNPIAQTDYADGTMVHVKLNMWLEGSAPVNSNLFLASYTTTTQEVGTSTTVATTGTTPSMVGEWTVFEYNACVRDGGKVYLIARIMSDAANTEYFMAVEDIDISDDAFGGDIKSAWYQVNPIAQTDYADGTMVHVKLNMWLDGSAPANSNLFFGSYTTTTQTVGTSTTVATTGTTPSMVGTWTVFEYNACVRDGGKVYLIARISSDAANTSYFMAVEDIDISDDAFGGDIKSAWYHVNQIAQTDYEEGTMVHVKLNMWLDGSAPTNSNLFFGSYTTTTQTVGKSTTVVATGTTPSMVGTWTEIEYNACVRSGGKVYLIARIASDAANTAYFMAFEDVEVTKIS